MLKLLRKIGRKGKVLAVVLGLVFVGGGVFVLSRIHASALTEAGDSITISVASDYWRYGIVADNDRYMFTNRFSVYNNTRGEGSYSAMCVNPKKDTPTGAGEAGIVSPYAFSSGDYKNMVETMLVTDRSYNSTVYDAFASYYDWQGLVDSVSDFDEVPSLYDKIYVIGHAMVSWSYNGVYDFLSSEAANALADMSYVMRQWFENTGRGSLYENYNMVYGNIPNTELQTVVWLEEKAVESEPEPEEGGQVSVWKQDADTHQTVYGAEVKLYKSDNSAAQWLEVGESGWIDVELGTWCAVEITPPDGYKLNSTPVCDTISSDGERISLVIEDEPEDPEEPETRAWVRLKKVDEDGNRIDGTGGVFTLKRKLSLYTETLANDVVVYSNGYSDWYEVRDADSYDTACFVETTPPTGYELNSEEECMAIQAGEYYTVTIVNEATPEPEVKGGIKIFKKGTVGNGEVALDGVTFALKKTGLLQSITIVRTDEFGVAQTGSRALDAGTYEIYEYATTANEAFAVSPTTLLDTVTLDSDGVVVDVELENELKDKNVAISSNATSGGGKTVNISSSASITDTVSLSGLTNGLTYSVSACPYVYSEGSWQRVTGVNGTSGSVCSGKSWTQSGRTSEQSVTFTIDTSGYAGKTIAIMTELYVENNGHTLMVKKHNEDLDDDAQKLTVETASISGTTAVSERSSDNKKVAVGTVKVIDTVSMAGLTSGVSYTVRGELRDENGNVVTLKGGATSKSESYTATASTGTTTMELEFDSSAYVGKKVTVYEELLQGGTVMSSHKVLGEAAQTVTVLTPTVGTTATGAAGKTVNVGVVEITDTVSYTGLVSGEQYKLEGEVIRKDTGARVGEVQSKTFYASGETGTETMKFEIDTTGLQGKELVVFEKLKTVGGAELAKHEDLDDAGQTVTVETVGVGTTATAEGGGKTLNVGVVKIIDTVSYTGLVEGESYKLVTSLAKKNGGATVGLSGGDSVETTFVAGTAGAGTVNVELTLDTLTLQGEELVVYEELYEGSNKLAEHKSLSDAGQTVSVKTATLGTVATDKVDGDNVIESESGQVIKDVVRYTGLVSGVEYTVKGRLMDKATGGELVVGGSSITVTKKFTPTTSDGNVTLEFNLNAKGLPGAEIVVFEKLYRGEIEMLKHEDLDDVSQYIKVRARIGTGAVDAYDYDDEVGVGEAKILDAVLYEGLEIGKTYKLKGSLIEKSSGNTVVTKEKTFTVGTGDVYDEDVEEVKDYTGGETGVVIIEFELNTKDYAGKSLVAFEELYDGSEVISEHKDINDEGQTVTVKTVKIGTVAKDKEDADKELAANAEVKVVDEVVYEGLVAGTKYVLKGTLVDKKTGKLLEVDGATEYKEFVARGEEGTVEIEFGFKTEGLSGVEIVVYEELYIGELEMDEEGAEPIVEPEDEDKLAEHKDLEDQKQTVWVKILKPDTGLLTRTAEGARNRGAHVAVGAIIIVAVGAIIVGRVVKKKRFGF